MEDESLEKEVNYSSSSFVLKKAVDIWPWTGFRLLSLFCRELDVHAQITFLGLGDFIGEYRADGHSRFILSAALDTLVRVLQLIEFYGVIQLQILQTILGGS